MKSNRSFALLTIISALISVWVSQTAQAGWQRKDLQAKSNDALAKLFAYDRAAGFDLKEVSAKEQDGVVIQDIDYAAQTPQRGRIKAYLIKPVGKGPFAGVLFFHWLGTPNGDRTQFLDEAVALAKQGAVSLLIQGYFPWVVEPSDGQTDGQRVVDETKEVRRALDLLLSTPELDRKRIGYVGHDYGAMYGSLAAAVDNRVKAYILIAGNGSFSDWSLDYWLKAKPAEFKASYREAFGDLEPIKLIGRAVPAELLFQFAKKDKYIPTEAATAFFDAAKQPKQIKWYDTIHEMNIEAARNDRLEWLAQKLSLNKSHN
jgi:dienelactone hydrolase